MELHTDAHVHVVHFFVKGRQIPYYVTNVPSSVCFAVCYFLAFFSYFFFILSFFSSFFFLFSFFPCLFCYHFFYLFVCFSLLFLICGGAEDMQAAAHARMDGNCVRGVRGVCGVCDPEQDADGVDADGLFDLFFSAPQTFLSFFSPQVAASKPTPAPALSHDGQPQPAKCDEDSHRAEATAMDSWRCVGGSRRMDWRRRGCETLPVLFSFSCFFFSLSSGDFLEKLKRKSVRVRTATGAGAQKA
jgi:hypothetical protein